jgi:glycosidase
MYDTLRDVICHQAPASQITKAWQAVDGIQHQMLNFLENHDEQRIASDFFAGNARAGIPGMIVAATMGAGPVMIYNGQELGERGMDDEGYSGYNGRTSIFDYWSMETIRTLLSGKPLSEEQLYLAETYAKLLNIARSEPAITNGAFHDLMYANTANPNFNTNRQYAFLRKLENDVLLIVANFEDKELSVGVSIPTKALVALEITDNQAAKVTDLVTGESTIGTLTAAYPYQLTLPPYSGKLLKFNYGI